MAVPHQHRKVRCQTVVTLCIRSLIVAFAPYSTVSRSYIISTAIAADVKLSTPHSCAARPKRRRGGRVDRVDRLFSTARPMVGEPQHLKKLETYDERSAGEGS